MNAPSSAPSSPSLPPLVSLVMGTRPEIIKMAPVALAIAALPQLRVEIIHTGQHEQMAWPLYEFFGLEPAHILTVDRGVEGLSGLSSQILRSMGELFARSRPAAVLVHGDTTSAAMGALAAAFSRIPIGHVEAGLRSGNIAEPFPEEINRGLIGRVAHWHYAPTQRAANNLSAENTPGQVRIVGNTVVDAVHHAVERLARHPSGGPSIGWWHASGLQRLIVVTAHRRENWGEPMRNILEAVREVLQRHGDAGVVWPVHLNPIVRDEVLAFHAGCDENLRQRWHLCQPLDYPEMVELMAACQLLLTDSGGIQEEAVSLGKPILVLRDVTERPEVIEAGFGRLVGTQQHTVIAACEAVLAQTFTVPDVANPFGDGQSARHIATWLAQELGVPQTTAG